MIKVQEIIHEGEVYTFQTHKVNQFDPTICRDGETVIMHNANVIISSVGGQKHIYVKQAYVTK